MPQQFPAKPPLGVIYVTTMDRPDAALALALLYGYEGKRDSRLSALCVAGSGLNTAIYCDIVQRFYHIGPARNSNSLLMVGLAPISSDSPDAPMIRPALEHQPEYPHGIRRFTDTANAETIIRNGISFNSDAAVLISGPATYVAKSMEILGATELYEERVRRLIVVDQGTPYRDPAALRKLIASWPSPVYYLGKAAGESVLYPGSAVETNFTWSNGHPVVDAYRGYRAMPYDAPTWDLLAAQFAVHPTSSLFTVSEPGELTVGDDGRLQFSPGGKGRVKSVSVDLAQKEELIETLVEVTSLKPQPPPQRFRPSAAEKK